MYDFILRDATIVSSAGRQVADLAVQDGKIVYVGQVSPKRRAKEELSVMGRFLMPGVIDTAVQFDPVGDRAVWERESMAALTGGVTTVIELPGTEVVDRGSAIRRAERGIGASWTHFGLWSAVQSGNVGDALAAADEGLVLGALAYAGGDDPRSVHPDELSAWLGCKGVLGIQIDGDDVIGALQKTAEQLLDLARVHGRSLHVVHLSTATELQQLDPVRGALPVTAGVTPHHLFFSEEGLNGLAERMHTRPQVRPEQDRRALWTAVKRGRLDCIASDHHTTNIGVPGSELLFPLMLSAVKFGRLSLEMLVALCSEGPARIFGLADKGRIAVGADADLVLFTEGELAKVDAAGLLSGAGWSPYADRDAALKPEVVMLDGRVVARKGKVCTEAPAGRFLRRA